MTNRTTVDLKNRTLAAFLTFLVPGLGQLYQGRTAKGLIFMISILSLFILGMALGGWSIVYWRWVNPMVNAEKFYVWYLGQLPAGLIALPAMLQATLNHYGMEPVLSGFQAEPSQNAINALYPRLGKLVEMGTIYTEIAGLLNVLAIFDAFDGPAYTDDKPSVNAGHTAKVADADATATVLNTAGEPEAATTGATV